MHKLNESKTKTHIRPTDPSSPQTKIPPRRYSVMDTQTKTYPSKDSSHDIPVHVALSFSHIRRQLPRQVFTPSEMKLTQQEQQCGRLWATGVPTLQALLSCFGKVAQSTLTMIFMTICVCCVCRRIHGYVVLSCVCGPGYGDLRCVGFLGVSF